VRKKKAAPTEDSIRKMIQDHVELRAKARRSIALLEKESSLSRRADLNLRVMRIAVALGDKLLEDAPRMIKAVRAQEAKAKKKPKRVRRSRKAVP
jgi:hypothetical protein